MDDKKIATYRKIGDGYEIAVPGEPTGFTSSIEELYKQLDHLKQHDFILVEDKKYPVHLDDMLH